MASLLGNLVFAGQQTLLSSQINLGAINTTANLYSINTGALQSIEVSLFQPAWMSQGTGAIAANVGFGAHTLPPLLFTQTGTTTVWYNPMTTVMPGNILASFFHSRIK